jgi:hypothetical protein
MDGGIELAGAWPPITPVSKGVGQGAAEGEWNARNPMVRSPELGRQWGGRVTVVRVVAVETLVRSALGLREWGMGARMSAVRRGEVLALL